MNDMFVRWMLLVQQNRQAGQGLVEYALILSLVSIACILALGALATGINGVFAAVTAAL